MPISNVTQWSATAASNVDIGGITLDGAVMTASQVDNALRELMAQVAGGISASYFIPASPVLTTPRIWDTSATHKYLFAVNELVADRTVTLPLLGADDTFVFAAFAQTLTNKSLVDATTFLVDDADTTKKVQFQLSGIATATTRTYTAPNASGTLVLQETVPSDTISGFIGAPANKSYTLVLKCPFAGTINETVTVCVSGTCTATFKINTTALGGAANSVSSTKQTVARSSANTFVAGDDIVLTISSNSSCVDMAFTIKVTKSF